MVSYVSKPLYKAVPHLGKLNMGTFFSYYGNLWLWTGAVGAGLAVFTEAIPLFQQTFYSKIPFFGQHWIHEVDPQDSPQ